MGSLWPPLNNTRRREASAMPQGRGRGVGRNNKSARKRTHQSVAPSTTLRMIPLASHRGGRKKGERCRALAFSWYHFAIGEFLSASSQQHFMQKL